MRSWPTAVFNSLGLVIGLTLLLSLSGVAWAGSGLMLPARPPLLRAEIDCETNFPLGATTQLCIEINSTPAPIKWWNGASWEFLGIQTDLDTAHAIANGDIQLDQVDETFIIWFGERGESASVRFVNDGSGNVVQQCLAADGETLCDVEAALTQAGQRFDITAEIDGVPTVLERTELAGDGLSATRTYPEEDWRPVGGGWYSPYALEYDETHCVLAASTIINSGPKSPIFTCAVHNSGIVYGMLPLRNSGYDGGPVQFKLLANHGTSESISCLYEAQAQLVAAGGAQTNTWTTVSADTRITQTITTANQDVWASSGPVQPTGSTDSTATLYWKMTRVASGSGANCANVRHLGVQLVYHKDHMVIGTAE